MLLSMLEYKLEKIWTPVKIIKKHNNHSYMYIIQTEHGSTFRRNRQLLKQTNVFDSQQNHAKQLLNKIRNKSRVRKSNQLW